MKDLLDLYPGSRTNRPGSAEASLKEDDELPLLEDDVPEDELVSPESGSHRVS